MIFKLISKYFVLTPLFNVYRPSGNSLKCYDLTCKPCSTTVQVLLPPHVPRCIPMYCRAHHIPTLHHIILVQCPREVVAKHKVKIMLIKHMKQESQNMQNRVETGVEVEEVAVEAINHTNKGRLKNQEIKIVEGVVVKAEEEVEVVAINHMNLENLNSKEIKNKMKARVVVKAEVVVKAGDVLAAGANPDITAVPYQ
jgi:hypothetical protein